MIIIERPGALALVQDLGRPGYADLGVPTSGAADRGALRLANRLVGNAENAAGLELLLGGATLTATALHWIAITGASVAARVDGRAVSTHSPIALRADQRLQLGPATRGLRCYVGVRGGVLVKPTLGSRSTDTLSGLGPPALRSGDRLEVGPPAGPLPATDLAPPRAPRRQLRVHPGPRRDWFTASAWHDLLTATWTLTTETDRVAARLDGPELKRVRADELPSEGLVRGAIQVPASGRPLVFLSDHPTTGGYPVIGVVEKDDVDQLAQVRPGESVGFAALG